MKSIISPAGAFGGFTEVNTLIDAYEADGTIYPFNVIGSPHSIEEWVPQVVAPVIEVPQKITKRQAYSQLAVLGKLDLVLPALQAIPDPLQSKLAIIEFQESTEFHRDRPLILTMGAVLGIDLDQAFIDAERNFP